MTSEDYESVQNAGRVLHEQGWRAAFSLNEMTDSWRSLVAEVEAGYDQMVDEYADAQGVPARMVRGDEEVEELRAGRAQQEQMAQMAQMADPAAKMAGAMKDLATTAPVEGNLAQSLGGAMQP